MLRTRAICQSKKKVGWRCKNKKTSSKYGSDDGPSSKRTKCFTTWIGRRKIRSRLWNWTIARCSAQMNRRESPIRLLYFIRRAKAYSQRIIFTRTRMSSVRTGLTSWRKNLKLWKANRVFKIKWRTSQQNFFVRQRNSGIFLARKAVKLKNPATLPELPLSLVVANLDP